MPWHDEKSKKKEVTLIHCCVDPFVVEKIHLAHSKTGNRFDKTAIKMPERLNLVYIPKIICNFLKMIRAMK